LPLHPCPQLPNGTSLCGHPAGAAQWPLFFVAAGPDAETSVPDLSDWCWPGHTGRWCAQCRDGFFSSGRLCKRCLPTGLHVLIAALNVSALLAVVVYLFKQQSSKEQARKELSTYLVEDDTVAASGLSRSTSMVNRARADPPQPSPFALHPHPEAHVIAPSPDATEQNGAEASVSDAPSNPLRVLLFHTQQLGLLLDSAAALPGALSGLLTVFSSAGNGLSLSSLVALECLGSWTLAHRCWMALAAPGVVGAAALAAHGVNCWRGRRRAMNLFAAADPQASPSDSLWEPRRVYSVCWSLLYLFVFPCATVALTALGCTERSEASVDLSRVYLNLQPFQRCDAQWRREILPPALLAALFWCVLFPLGSTWALWRARRTVHRASGDVSAEFTAPLSSLSDELRSGSDHALALPSRNHAARIQPTGAAFSAWSLSREQLSPYRPSFWYYEQVLLARRLLLALNLAFLLVLIGGLFAFVRHKVTVHWPKLRAALLRCAACLSCNSAAEAAASEPAKSGAAEMRELKRSDRGFDGASELGAPLLE